MVDFAVRAPNVFGPGLDGWKYGIGQYLSPFAVWDGTKWRVFAGGPGPAQLKVRDSNGDWLLIGVEGYEYARMLGHVTSNGVAAANRRLYFHQNSPVGTVVDNCVTDGAGNYEDQFLPFNVNIYVRAFHYANNFSYVNSTVSGPFVFTQGTRTQTLDFAF